MVCLHRRTSHERQSNTSLPAHHLHFIQFPIDASQLEAQLAARRDARLGGFVDGLIVR